MNIIDIPNDIVIRNIIQFVCIHDVIKLSICCKILNSYSEESIKYLLSDNAFLYDYSINSNINIYDTIKKSIFSFQCFEKILFHFDFEKIVKP